MKVQDLLFFSGVVHVGQATFAAVLPIEMSSHENAGTALFAETLTTQTVDLAIIVDAIVLEHGKLDLLVLVFLLLGCGVVLLLAFLGTTSEPQHQVILCRYLTTNVLVYD